LHLFGRQVLRGAELGCERCEHAPFYDAARKEETEIAVESDFIVTYGLPNRSAQADTANYKLLWLKKTTAF